MKSKFYLLMLSFALVTFSLSMVKAQGGMSVSPNGAAPDNSAGLDVNFSDKGLLMPRLTTAQRNAIVNPASGLVIYNTDCSVFNFNAGTPGNPNWATLNSSNVLAAGISIASYPIGAICAGASVTFTATPSQNNLSPSYQWKVNGSNVGTNSTTYTTSSLNNGDVVTCILTSSVACVTGSPAASNALTMLVNTVPAITGTTTAAFCSGTAVTLGASASLGTINWYTNSTGGSSLSTGASFTVSGLDSTTTYYVDATANGCTTASRTAVAATAYPGSPGQPGTITGPSSVNTDSIAIYSINPVPNTVSYTWTGSLLSIVSGQGTTSIGVLWQDTAGIGGVSVVANNPCGTSIAQILPVNVGTQTFSYTGGAQSFTVPTGITSVTITAYGAAGGGGSGGTGSGGLGGSATGTLAVTPGEVLQINIGGIPNGYTGGWNGGGGGGNTGSGTWAGAGGGGTDVRTPADYSVNGRVIVAGGGGGWGNEGYQGGDGGGTTGDSYGSSQSTSEGEGGGGTQSAGGSAGVDYQGPWPQYATNGNAGSFGVGGDGVYNPSSGYLTGGGGGGWYGGGSGATSGQWAGGSGGGGSGYVGGVTNSSMQTGVQSGNGQIVLTW